MIGAQMSPRAILALCKLSVLLWCAGAFALNPTPDILSQYAHTGWTYRNGPLQGAVYAITQTPDGYLWLETQSGVVRFDGVRAVPLSMPEQQLPIGTVGALLAARDGTLWIGTLDGLVSWKNGQLTEHPALARHTVLTLLEDHTGTVWAGGTAGPTAMLCAIRGGSTTCHGDDGSLGTVVASLFEDANGSMWVGATSGLWRWSPGAPTRFLATTISRGAGMAQGDHGSGLILAAGSVRQIVGRTVTNYPLRGVPSGLSATTVLRDRNGGLWIGTTGRGLIHSYEGKTSVFSQRDGLSSDQVYTLFEGREGSIWVGTSEGLDQFRELPVSSLSVKQGLPAAAANSVLAARDGSIWIGTTDGLSRWKAGRTTIYRKRDTPGLPDDEIQSLFEDERGRIWVSSFSGLASFENGKFTPVPSVPAGAKNAIAGDKGGGLWLSLFGSGKHYSLAHLVDGKIIEEVSWAELGGGPGTGLLPDPYDGIWTGLLSGGMAYFRAGQIQNLPLSDGQTGARRVLDISRDRDGSIWAATENGLSRIKNGHVATLTMANGLPCKTLHWIIEDELSSYWLYTQCGLLRVARTEVEAWTADPRRRIQVTRFDADDGVRLVPILKGFRPAVTKALDGKIWFINGETVSLVDPSRISINTLPPPVHIEQITADGKVYDASNGLRLRPGVRDVLVDFTALSLLVPEKVRFRIMLDGQDKEWRDLVNQRRVHYTNLAPRTYRFRVLASNNSEVWNEQGATLQFVIPPAWYQTTWFWILCAVTFLLLVWMAYQLRVRRLAAQFNMRLEERVGERTRIARDLHDTLLQSFHGLLVRFQSVLQLLPERPLDAKQRLESTIDEAAEAITEARDAVQGLRSSTVITNELALTLKTLGEELAMNPINSGTPHFRVEVFGASRELHPIVRDEVYRLAAEALRNAFLHAHARQIEVELRYNPRELVVVVRDDGKGMDPQVLDSKGKAGHYGLRGMHERAKLLRGKLELWSELNAGTQIELTVPGANAYAKMLQSRWQLMRFSRLGKEKKMKIES